MIAGGPVPDQDVTLDRVGEIRLSPYQEAEIAVQVRHDLLLIHPGAAAHALDDAVGLMTALQLRTVRTGTLNYAQTQRAVEQVATLLGE